MKVKHLFVLLIVVFLAGISLTYWYLRNRGQSGASPAQSNTSPAPLSIITTAHPTRHVFIHRLPWLGTVETRAMVPLTAQVAGQIEAIEVKDRALVDKGKLVMRLGGPRIEGIRAKLKAEVESLKARIKLARQRVDRLGKSLETKLATKDQVAAAQGEENQLNTQLRAIRVHLQTLDKRVRITAPMHGIFTNRLVSLGQNVKAGQAVGDIIDPLRLRIEASLFPQQGSQLQGKEAIVLLNKNRALSGVVSRILPQAVDTGATKVWIEGPEIDSQLRPGLMVEGCLILKTESKNLAVPESAIVYDKQEHPYLFVRHGDTYKSHKVKLGLVQDGWAEVLSGVGKDQQVVTQGAFELYYRQFNKEFKVRD